MGHVEYADMSTARPPQVDDIQFMGGEHTHSIRTDQEAIAVELDRRLVMHIVETKLCGIAEHKQILPVEVGNDNALVSPVKGIQLAVRLFLQHVEEDEVVLKAVIAQITKQACPKVRIVKNKTAKIAHEGLDAELDRYRVIAVTQIG